MVLEVPDDSLVVVDQGQIDVDVVRHGGIGTAVGDPLARANGPGGSSGA
jgi:hypothetical protein